MQLNDFLNRTIEPEEAIEECSPHPESEPEAVKLIALASVDSAKMTPGAVVREQSRDVVRAAVAEIMPPVAGALDLDHADVAGLYDMTVEHDLRLALAWRQFYVSYEAVRAIAGELGS